MNENKNTEDAKNDPVEQAQEPQEVPETTSKADDGEVRELSVDDEIEQLKEQLAQQADEAAAMKDAYIRAKAEEDNVRRRAEKEVSNSRKFAVEGFAKELLSVRDSLAIAAALELEADSNAGVRA